MSYYKCQCGVGSDNWETFVEHLKSPHNTKSEDGKA